MKRWMGGLVLGVSLVAFPAVGSAAPRPLSEAERQAVALAALYLRDGAQAWWDRLAADSPLRELGRDTAIREIEVRAGSSGDARWRLRTVPESAAALTAVFTLEFPSGMDEILLLRLREEEDGWKLHTLRMSAEPAEGFEVAEAASEPEAAAAAPEMSTRGYALIGGLALLLGSVLLFRAGKRPFGLGLGVAAVAALAVAAVLYLRPPSGALTGGEQDGGARDGGAKEGGGRGSAGAFGRDLEKLLGLRRALARWDPAALQAARANPPAEEPATRVARLWEAQHLLTALDFGAVEHILHSFPPPANIPRAELLRARLGFLRLNDIATGVAYQSALDAGLRHDGLLVEAANSFLLLGFEERARIYYEELAELGSREAEVYYELADWAVIDHAVTKASELFRTAWSLEPLRREQILRWPGLAFLVEDRTQLKDQLHLDSVNDPKVACRDRSSRPLSLPEGADARLLGSLLAIEIGDGEIEVPGGCEIAPPQVEIFDAQAWLNRREARVLDELPTLLEAVQSAGALSQPRVRRQVEEAVEALARRHRWTEVIELTDGLESDVGSVPSELISRRATALGMIERDEEARTLLIALATANAAGRRVDPGTLYQLSELLVSEGQYDQAMGLIAKANSQLPFEPPNERILQIRIEKRLVSSSLVYESEHFKILYPQDRSFYFAEKAAEILEAERKRLKQWIPLDSDTVTQVFLPEWEDFNTSHGGGAIGILGLFDGRIRLPLGDVTRFHPVIVAIMTHELAHAMITEATRDRTPRWFHEGLAGHVQMWQARVNPISGYRQTSSLLAFPLIESVLGGFAAPRLVPIAYEEALWTLHFIESRFGRRGIHRLLRAFADGANTEEALSKALGMSVEEFDRQLWTWCRDEAPDAWPTELIDYEEE
ncbi:MAG: hypothetical protein GY856_05410 [bacterium]|nr:hypothetical protein [bacterium]